MCDHNDPIIGSCGRLNGCDCNDPASGESWAQRKQRVLREIDDQLDHLDRLDAGVKFERTGLLHLRLKVEAK
jgi:hypothetical protein